MQSDTTDNSRTASMEVALRKRFNSIAGAWLRSRFSKIVDGFQHGRLRIEWPDGTVTEHGVACDPQEMAGYGSHENPVVVQLHNYEPVRRMALGGSIAWAEAYMDGQWTTNSIMGLFLLFLANEKSLPGVVNGSRLTKLANVVGHRFNKNTLHGSKRNIASHYDLGNDFYGLWLDETMSYSSACYEFPEQSLLDAQRNKMAKVLDAVDARKTDNILEIGCGWGAMATALAGQAGCDVTGISLSGEQLAYARRSAKQRSLNGKINFAYQDYRQVEGKFDHVVSIEMFEAVGREYWSDYFEKLQAVLKRGGSAVLQVITIIEDRFERYTAQPDFIQKYIFPGGMLPTKSLLQQHAERHGFKVSNVEFFGESYARTLLAWREQFDASLNDIREQGYDERFANMWRYYLAYCEAGFTTGSTDVGIWTLTRK